MAKSKQNSDQQADPAKLAGAMRATPMTGKSAEKWADEVWGKATGKGTR